MAATGSVSSLESKSSLEDQIRAHEKVIVQVTADWSEPSKHMETVFAKLATRQPNIRFAKIDINTSGISDTFQVSSVPTFLFFQKEKLESKQVGASAPVLLKAVQAFASGSTSSGDSTEAKPVEESEEVKKAKLHKRLKSLIEYAPVMLFMKGTPAKPECKFSRRMVELLKSANISFSSFNILADPEVRAELKVYSDWLTYPQLYIDGKLVGGLDVVKELIEEGEFEDMIPNPKKKLHDKLHALINQAPCMLFMKGSPDAPKCGFSNRIVKLLKEHNVKYSSFDILSDPEVRQGLKDYSNWMTYPQLYVNGKLLGGLDVCIELAEEGELEEALQEADTKA